MLYHITGVHRWEDKKGVHECAHPPFTEEDQEFTKWLDPVSSAYRVVESLVTDKKLLTDLKQMSHFKHTGKKNKV